MEPFTGRELYLMKTALWLRVQGMKRSAHLYKDDGSFAESLAENTALLKKLDVALNG